MSKDKEPEDIIQFLVDMGILKPMGYDENIGEQLYLITEEANTFMPELSKHQQQEINSVVFDLWQMEMLDVSFNDEGEPLVALNENSTNIEKVMAIEDPDLRNQMRVIVSVFSSYFDKNNNQ